MCRGHGEPGGPKRCPAHARLQLEKSIAAVEELEAREEQFRAALAVALDMTQRSHSAAERLSRLEHAVRAREAELEDDPEDDPEYLELQRALSDARRHHDAVRPGSTAALSVLRRRREQAAAALRAVGVNAAATTEHLDDIEVNAGFAPPF